MNVNVFSRSCETSVAGYVGAIVSGSMALPADLSLIRSDSDPVCSAAGRVRLFWNTSSNVSRLSSPGSSSYCLNECFVSSSDSSPTCTYETADLSKNASVLTSQTVSCYCSSRMISAIKADGLINGARAVYYQEKDLCKKVCADFLHLFLCIEYINGCCVQISGDFILFHAFTIVASLVIVIM